MTRAFFCAVATVAALSAAAASHKDANGIAWEASATKDWHGFTACTVASTDGTEAMVVAPKKARSGNPWIWCCEWPDAFVERTGAVAALEDGFYYVHLKVGVDCNGSPKCLQQMDAFYQFLQTKGLAKKGIVTGVSRGGFYAWRFASKFPERIAGIYGDAPCCDFKSYPIYLIGSKTRSFNREQFALIRELYGFDTMIDLVNFRGNPLDWEALKPVADAKIPVLHVVGAADQVVPPEYNTFVLERRYRELGGEIEVIVKPGCDHHPHGLDDPKPILDFFRKCMTAD